MVPPHLSVQGVTLTPQRPDKNQKSERTAKWCVFIRKGKDTFIKLVSGSNFPGAAINKQYRDGKGNIHKTLSGEEYRDITKELMRGQGIFEGKGVSTRSSSACNLLHDRDTTHTSGFFKRYAEGCRLTVVLLSPCSPDLNPLDGGFLGTVKTKLRRAVRSRRLSWQATCEEMERLLREEDSSAYIDELPLRWQACVNAKGWHIERELRHLKRQRRQTSAT